MFSRLLKRAAAFSALIIIFAIAASAQTGQVEGFVKVKNADGSVMPVAGALVDIYRLDIKGHWEVKTDKSGHFVRIGLPLQGTYVFVASAPGITPTWINNVRITQTPVLPDIIATPGDGTRLTFEQLMAGIKGSSAPAQPGTRQPSAEDKAKADAAAKEYAAKVEEHKALQAALDEAIKHFNTGVQLKQANNYEGAVAEFEQAATLDPTKDKAFLEVSYKSLASLAETHYMLGADIFNKNKKAVPEAKPHFEQAIKSIAKAIDVASTDTTNANINNELLIYYNIYARSVKPLVQYYGNTDVINDAVKMFDKAEAIDAANKNKWEILKGELYRLAYRSDEAVAVFKQILATDPNNADALYGIGLTLVASGEKDKLQDAANYLADFVSKAKPDDPRVAEVNQSLQALKDAFKVEAEPKSRRSRKP
ncbi:MAG TPA: carboxypeptidase regulatory-like domain-containing protein [Blastocatellia bacterium]|nr:carboxypeptidase regulatory-like domain-containing protein [Blastocatellia bacterium]